MIDDSAAVTVEVEARFLKLQAQEDPGLVIPSTIVTCPICRATGLAAGQSGCAVVDAIDAMKNNCRGLEPWFHDYVPARGTEPPDDLLPA